MQITPAVHALRHQFRIPVGPGLFLDRFVYSFILAGETIVLIDTGVAGAEQRIFEYLQKIGRDHHEISLIILTHSHPDHIGAAKAIRDRTGCAVMAHQSERAWIEDVELQNRERPVPGFSGLVGGSVPVSFEISDGDTIDPDGTAAYEIDVIHTPGHSAGSLSLFLRSEGTLFCGDAVPVYGDLPVYDDAEASLRSVRQLREMRDIRWLLSAWDEPGDAKTSYGQMDRAIAYLQEIDDAVLRSAAGGTSDIMELTKRTATCLSLPPQAVSPLLARTFASNLRLHNLL